MSRAIRLEIEKHGGTIRDLPDEVLHEFAGIVDAYAVDLREEQTRRRPEGESHSPQGQEKVVVLSHGFVHATICVPERMPIAEVLEEANRRLGPTGLPHGWMLSDDPEFAGPVLPDGKKFPNPCPCERTPGRIHRLLEC